jgi:hypothetical protein
MSNKLQLHREMRRDILRLRAQSYRQEICSAMLSIKNPWKMLGTRLPWLAGSEELSFLFHELKNRKHSHPLWRILLGVSVLARLWWKNKKRH